MTIAFVFVYLNRYGGILLVKILNLFGYGDGGITFYNFNQIKNFKIKKKKEY